MRVAVPFGSKKLYTGIVYQVHKQAPVAYKAKEIHAVLDTISVVTKDQIKHWEWIASYYMCTLGEVMRAALPSAFLLQSETNISLDSDFNNPDVLSENEFLIYEALHHHDMMDLHKVSTILSRKNVLTLVKSMLEKKAIHIQEVLYEKYTPKYTEFLHLHPQYAQESSWESLLQSLDRAPKQKEILLSFFQERAKGKPIKKSQFIKAYAINATTLRALLEKEILQLYTLQEQRLQMGESSGKFPVLSDVQQIALDDIRKSFDKKDAVLFHGVTGSGKTEIYIHLIEKVLQQGKQCLYLVPEIALTTQLLERLKIHFAEQITVFHSRYNLNERVEVWQSILENKSHARLIVGARSAVLLPFQDLGLIIVDEEHETSYKQFDPAPRYHARDTALVLGKQMKAKVLLGTATPSIETYQNVQTKKYGYVALHERFENVPLPETELVDTATLKRKKAMKGLFSPLLLDKIQEALEAQEQVILFQNRRGYSPVVECTTCATTPHCPNCDVSLTYHKSKNELHCHYCGHTEVMPQVCPACHNPSLVTVGFGTEQLEDELHKIFPTHQIARMDYDTTRGKNAYYNIIQSFQAGEIDILVGTQMLTKGLDFSNVSLVGVIHADSLFNFPDFRAHEHSFQMLVQVSGRAGRAEKRGKVIIQTYNVKHPVLQWVKENNYADFFENQISERWAFKYPPYYKIIKITLKHKQFDKVQRASEWLGTTLFNYFSESILGPTAPAIPRIRNQYLMDILLKIAPEQSVSQTKKTLQKIKNHFQSIPEFRSVRFVIDVDPQ
jgi:primosomal protein N' (replication factor Y)